MWNFLFSFLKVCFRHGEELIDFAKEVMEESKKNSPSGKELTDMEEKLLDSKGV